MGNPFPLGSFRVSFFGSFYIYIYIERERERGKRQSRKGDHDEKGFFFLKETLKQRGGTVLVSLVEDRLEIVFVGKKTMRNLVFRSN